MSDADIKAHLQMLLTDDQRARFGVYEDGQQSHMAVMRCLSVLSAIDKATGSVATYVHDAEEVRAIPSEVERELFDAACQNGRISFHWLVGVFRRGVAYGRSAPVPLRGFVDGVLYCYGGCGRRYQDFGLDVILPTPLWNQIAVGAPFDETQTDIEREGRGGVLCAQCIVDRLKGLPGVTCALLGIREQEQK